MEQTLNADEKSIVDTFELLPSEEELDYDKEVLLAAIMRKGGTFEPLYTDPEYFYWDCSMWWKKWRRNFTKQAEALQIEYKPLENYRRNEIEHSDTVDAGTLAQATHNQEVMDDDTSRNLRTTGEEDGTTSHEAETILAATGSTSGTKNATEVVDEEGTKKIDHTETVDEDTTEALTRNETIDRDTSKTTSDREVMDDDTTMNKTTGFSSTVTETGSGSNELQVSAFNNLNPLDAYDPKNLTTTQDTRTTTTSSTTTESGTGTDDRTTTKTGSETGTEDVDTDTTENKTGTRDVTTTGSEDENDTLDRSTTLTETTSGTSKDDSTTNVEESGTAHKETTGSETETGTDDRTTTANGTLNQNTSNDRDWDHTSEIWGNIGVTTSQKMLQEELEIRKWNLYDFMSDRFVDECCVRVY